MAGAPSAGRQYRAGYSADPTEGAAGAEPVQHGADWGGPASWRYGGSGSRVTANKSTIHPPEASCSCAVRRQESKGQPGTPAREAAPRALWLPAGGETAGPCARGSSCTAPVTRLGRPLRTIETAATHRHGAAALSLVSLNVARLCLFCNQCNACGPGKRFGWRVRTHARRLRKFFGGWVGGNPGWSLRPAVEHYCIRKSLRLRVRTLHGKGGQGRRGFRGKAGICGFWMGGGACGHDGVYHAAACLLAVRRASRGDHEGSAARLFRACAVFLNWSWGRKACTHQHHGEQCR